MSDDSGDTNNISNKSPPPETASSNEETIKPKACIQLAESGPDGVPSRLRLLCDCLTEQTSIAYLIAALQLLMLESGFVLPQPETSHEDAQQMLNSDFIIQTKISKDGRTQTYIFTLREVYGCECKLMITNMGDVLLINSFTDLTVAAYSIVLPIKYYVPRPDVPLLYEKFDHLEELSLTFKNSVATPVRAAILAAKGIAAASLLGLPPEILNNILEYCGPINVCKIAQTCRALSIAIKEQRLWFYFVKKHFPKQVSHISQTKEVDWMKEYQTAFASTFKIRVKRNLFQMPSFSSPNNRPAFLNYFES